MTPQRAISVIENEAECVRRQTRPGCDRRCEKCDLVLEDKEVLEAYAMATEALTIWRLMLLDRSTENIVCIRNILNQNETVI